MATLTFSGLPSGVVKTSMDNVTYTEATSPITLINGMYIWVSSSWSLIGKPTTYVNSVYVNENENDVWSNSRENPFILTYGGVLNYTTSSTQTATSAFIAKYVEQPKTTLDLSTLSDIADGTHTVKVKAKASGYNDSEFSNEVSYTKAAAGKRITALSAKNDGSAQVYLCYLKFDGVASPTNYDVKMELSEGGSWDITYNNNSVTGSYDARMSVDFYANKISIYSDSQFDYPWCTLYENNQTICAGRMWQYRSQTFDLTVGGNILFDIFED